MKAFAVAVALVFMGTAVVQTAADATDHVALTTKPAQATHKGVGVVKKVDARGGTVTLAHEAVKTLDWPAMTMSFKVSDKALLDKLVAGKKVDFEFQQRGKDYVITRID